MKKSQSIFKSLLPLAIVVMQLMTTMESARATDSILLDTGLEWCQSCYDGWTVNSGDTQWIAFVVTASSAATISKVELNLNNTSAASLAGATVAFYGNPSVAPKNAADLLGTLTFSEFRLQPTQTTSGAAVFTGSISIPAAGEYWFKFGNLAPTKSARYRFGALSMMGISYQTGDWSAFQGTPNDDFFDGGVQRNLNYYPSMRITGSAAPATTAPNAPTIGTATALSATSASISFTAPASNGGATIETYTVTSTPGSITARLTQSGSGSIIITGLTPSTTYTFRVTASNRIGTSASSSATVSITTPASDAELAAQAAAAAAAAAAKREEETRLARTEIASKFKNSEKVTLESFKQAEIPGVTSENLAAVQAEIQSLPKESRSDITQITKVARKYEVIGKIASEQINNFNANDLIEVGLIPTDTKNKMALATTLKKLPQQDRDTYAEIKAAIDAASAKIQARKEKVQALIFRKPSLSQK